jgi:hypothetical protein
MNARFGLILILLLLAGNDPQVSAQRTPPDLGNARRETLLYVTDPFAGTWNLNAAESRFVPGPPLKSGTIKVEEKNDGFRCILDPVDSQGNSRHGEWTAKYDGKNYPAAMTPFADAIALHRIGTNTMDAVYRKGGKEVLSERWVVSGNGRSLTITQKGKDAPAQEIDNTLLYEKQ